MSQFIYRPATIVMTTFTSFAGIKLLLYHLDSALPAAGKSGEQTIRTEWRPDVRTNGDLSGKSLFVVRNIDANGNG